LLLQHVNWTITKLNPVMLTRTFHQNQDLGAKDQDFTLKDQDQDLSVKDQDKDLSSKDQDQDFKFVLKDFLRTRMRTRTRTLTGPSLNSG